MNTYTLIGKKHTCPLWNISLTISGKYRLDDESNPYTAKYVSCSCPILENLILPVDKQNKKYELFRFCNISQECLSSIDFAPEIDIRKDGYSQ